MYSAKKIAGKKLYELAREGKSVERAPVPVQIFKLQATSYKPPYLTLEIHCSSGTYVRSLARDIGEALGCGAYVEELERLGIGPFSIEEAVPIDDIAAKDGLEKHIIAAETIVRRAMSCQGN
jgi:tRNA pseudouridine55 synthase